MLWANRNGFFYVLDRVTGQFLMAKAFVKQNWNLGFDRRAARSRTPSSGPSRWEASWSIRARRAAPTGTRRRTARAPGFSMLRPGTIPAAAPRSTRPAHGKSACVTPEPHRRPVRRPGGAPRRGRRPLSRKEDEGYGAVRALDPRTGEKKWDFKMVNYTEVGRALDRR